MVFVKMMVFCWFLTKNHHKTIIFPTYGFGMVLINFSSDTKANFLLTVCFLPLLGGLAGFWLVFFDFLGG